MPIEPVTLRESSLGKNLRHIEPVRVRMLPSVPQRMATSPVGGTGRMYWLNGPAGTDTTILRWERGRILTDEDMGVFITLG